MPGQMKEHEIEWEWDTRILHFIAHNIIGALIGACAALALALPFSDALALLWPLFYLLSTSLVRSVHQSYQEF